MGDQTPDDTQTALGSNTTVVSRTIGWNSFEYELTNVDRYPRKMKIKSPPIIPFKSKLINKVDLDKKK